MATYVFNGSQSLTIPNFDVDADLVAFDDLDVSDIATVTDAPAGATITTTSGTTLVFAGLALSDIAGLSSTPANLIQVGTNGNDGLLGGESGSVLLGLNGVDTLTGTDADDLILGNLGNDVITGNGGSDRLYGGQGNDTINFGVAVVEGVVTADAADVDTAVLAVGGLGQDTITGSVSGSATVFGGNEASDPTDGADLINLTLADGATATVYGNGGSDFITITASAGSDVALGAVTVYGGQGADTIDADVGADSAVYGGLGSDSINLDVDGSATVYGGNGFSDTGDGSDYINVNVSADAADGSVVEIFGNGGSDYIEFDAEGVRGGVTASIYGGQGSDEIDAYGVGEGSAIVGGVGSDYLDVTVAGSDASVYGGNGFADASDGADYIYVGLQSAEATPAVLDNAATEEDESAAAQSAIVASVDVYGNGGDDYINVYGQGNASVFGGAGDDYIEVEAFENVVGGIAGELVLTGGVGSDTFDIEGSGQADGQTIVQITDFNFNEDFIAGNADSVVQVSGNVNEFADLQQLALSNNDEGASAVLITVGSGAFAGSYLAYSNESSDSDYQIVEITGFTGDVDANVFTSGGFNGSDLV